MLLKKVSFNKNTKSGVQDHINKFKDTLGSDRGYREFVQEMEGVLSAKVEFGILPKELEGVKRNLYTGSICYFDLRVNSDLNICIFLLCDNEHFFSL